MASWISYWPTKSTTPENLFLEDDLYTMVGDAGERDASLEHGFAKLEAAGAHFLRQLLDIVRAGLNQVANEPHWTDADRASMADPKDVDRIKRNARIAAQATGPTEELLEAMRSRRLTIYVAPQSAAFVLGDHPTAMAKLDWRTKEPLADYLFRMIAAIGGFEISHN